MPNPFPDIIVYNLPDEINQPVRESPSKEVVLVLFEQENQEQSLSYVKKIMASVHKYLDQDISLIFLHPKSAIRYAANHHQPSTKYLISFGPGPQTLGFNFRNILYHPFSTDQCTYLFADSVLDIQSSKEEKKKLWSALKSMFA